MVLLNKAIAGGPICDQAEKQSQEIAVLYQIQLHLWAAAL